MADPRKKGGPRPGAGRKPSSETTVLRLPVPIADVARRMAAAHGGRSSGIAAFLTVEGRTSAEVPFVTGSVACGFPSPADDYMERPLDFNELLSANAPSVFAVRVAGESMSGAGLLSGDVVVVDRALAPRHGCIIVACLNREFTLKTYLVRGGQVVLRPENPAFPEIVVPEEAEFEIWGVVTGSMRTYRP